MQINKTFFNTIASHIAIIKKGRMDKEQAVCEQLTLSDFKKWSFTALKNFNNYTIIMTNNSDKIRI